ncbi:hypothetical protein FA95DRAFT_1560626 [Auriscalpium vulgare]|uniref:Uncharacterized protein n=1 Tax=Auriscalpium vulgare TaxID=40419 RepID=A0ACB8RP43_9AGAM|nr:hypothetical protein FA95DRAFT_1560626 [Auriscalpium vulgare]
MSFSESQDIEGATTAIQSQPDNKTRRYDRQLRLWAASGQTALEQARVLLISASALSTSTLKNLVLPGVGHFTILDSALTTPADIGNNFFLDPDASLGRHRADEAVRLLLELNEGVEGVADTSDIESVLAQGPSYFSAFTLVIAVNLPQSIIERLSPLLWDIPTGPPLIVVRSAGFLAEFFIQFHDHDVIESHSETAPSLRVDKPFPELLNHALQLDLKNMDPTDHGHIPYVVILVRALEDWKREHGAPPSTYAEKRAFKESVMKMQRHQDEENFEEAAANAYRAYTSSTIPSSVQALFDTLPPPDTPLDGQRHFSILLSALRAFTSEPPHVLPLSATLPDMKSDTENYVALQNIYRRRADEERAVFRQLVRDAGGADIPAEVVDLFCKNAHAIAGLKGARWGDLDTDREKLVSRLQTAPREMATHIALSALSAWLSLNPITQTHANGNANASAQNAASLAPPLPTAEALLAIVQGVVGIDVELGKEVHDAVGEAYVSPHSAWRSTHHLHDSARAPTADLPNVAAFMGGLIAQEAIKMITKQYVPVNGHCVIDLVDTWTGIIA